MRILVPYRYGMIVNVLLDYSMLKLLMIHVGINFVRYTDNVKLGSHYITKTYIV